MKKNKQSILFLGKKGDEYCQKALEFCNNNFECVESYMGEWGEKLPTKIHGWHGDIIISYLSRWIVPDVILEKAKKYAINFHPATPEYPGIGCINFALYDNVAEYGATCHHMNPDVDTGSIIRVNRIPVSPEDNVESLLQKTYGAQIELFYDVLDFIVKNESLPKEEYTWSRKPYTRKEFNALMLIDPTMNSQEVNRRIRATSFGDWQPRIELHGHVFELKLCKERK